jgi:tartrate dehydrogenase/decarboxylase/D-malate dehydrogenase
MLEHLREEEAAARLMQALEDVCRDGPRTRDVGGEATTREVGEAVAARLG